MSSYFAPYIDSNGFHRPTYSQILDNLISNYKSIYGQDVYLGNDSADYQWISIVAYRLNDATCIGGGRIIKTGSPNQAG